MIKTYNNKEDKRKAEQLNSDKNWMAHLIGLNKIAGKYGLTAINIEIKLKSIT